MPRYSRVRLLRSRLHPLTRLQRPNKAEIIWIPGHCYFFGKGEADRLARKGSALTMTGPKPEVGLTFVARRSQIKTGTNERHLMICQSLTDV